MEYEKLDFDDLNDLSNKGDLKATYFLALEYLNVKNAYFDEESGIDNLVLAAEKGYHDAQYLLGIHYFSGSFVFKDINKGLYYLDLAAKNKNITAIRELAEIYIDGKETEQNYNQAREYLVIGAKENDPYCMVNLGHFFDNGFGVSINKKLALQWYIKASKKDNPSAMFFLAMHYYQGVGTDKDETKARYWLEKSAVSGYTGAMYVLGAFYSNGTLFKKNDEKAKKWLFKAHDLGFKEAFEFLYQRYEFELSIHKQPKTVKSNNTKTGKCPICDKPSIIEQENEYGFSPWNDEFCEDCISVGRAISDFSYGDMVYNFYDKNEVGMWVTPDHQTSSTHLQPQKYRFSHEEINTIIGSESFGKRSVYIRNFRSVYHKQEDYSSDMDVYINIYYDNAQKGKKINRAVTSLINRNSTSGYIIIKGKVLLTIVKDYDYERYLDNQDDFY